MKKTPPIPPKDRVQKNGYWIPNDDEPDAIKIQRLINSRDNWRYLCYGIVGANLILQLIQIFL